MALRLDRFITLHVVEKFNGTLVKAKPSKGRHIPILMYHSISDKTERCHPYYRTTTTPDVFKRHLAYLKAHHYEVLSLDSVTEILKYQRKIPAKAVVITFDDGFHDFYLLAAPLLSQYGFTATVFLPSDYINEVRKQFKGVDCLTWNEIRSLRGMGFTMGSHTRTHPSLTQLTKNKVRWEIQSSKEEIEDKLGEAISLFSYPFAFPDHDSAFRSFFIKVLKENDYVLGVTTRLGEAALSDLPYLLKRIPVNGCDDMALFSAKLNGSYNWLYGAQLFFKKGKAFINHHK